MTARKQERTGTGDGASVKPELPVVTLAAVDLNSVEALRRCNTETSPSRVPKALSFDIFQKGYEK